MRILVNDYSGHPFQVELSRELAARGHAVLHLYSGDFQSPKGDLCRHADDPATFDVAGLRIGVPFQKYNFVKRRGQEIAYARLVRRRIDAFKPDLVVGCNNPLDAQQRIQDRCRRLAIPFVFWLQDIYSNAIRCILNRRLGFVGDAIGAYYQALERRLLRRADHVVAISEDFLPQLWSWRVRRADVSVIENWAAATGAQACLRDNAWSRENNLLANKVALYSGTIGLKHDPDLLVAAAAAFQSDPEVKLVILSEGKFADRVADEAAGLGLNNLVVMPFQPYERYSEALAAADVLIAMIEKDAASYSVPSKVLSYLRAGRPIVLAAPQSNLAARTVQRARAGCVVSPGNVEEFVAAIAGLFADEARRASAGASAIAYAQSRFAIGALADRFETVFAQASARRRLPVAGTAPSGAAFGAPARPSA